MAFIIFAAENEETLSLHIGIHGRAGADGCLVGTDFPKCAATNTYDGHQSAVGRYHVRHGTDAEPEGLQNRL